MVWSYPTHEYMHAHQNTHSNYYLSFLSLVKKGFGKETDIKNLSKGKYYLCYDNQVAEFDKKK